MPRPLYVSITEIWNTNQHSLLTGRNFFSFVYKKLGHANNNKCIDINGTASDIVVAEIFHSKATDTGTFISNTKASSSQQFSLILKCSEDDVASAIRACSSTNSSPDGLSYKLLKAIAKCIFWPLNMILQQSLFTGVFPLIWKKSVVIPLYKG